MWHYACYKLRDALNSLRRTVTLCPCKRMLTNHPLFCADPSMADGKFLLRSYGERGCKICNFYLLTTVNNSLRTCVTQFFKFNHRKNFELLRISFVNILWPKIRNFVFKYFPMKIIFRKSTKIAYRHV